MNTDSWKATETQKDFQSWLSFYEGCLMCACDHGCNQWVKEQTQRAALLFRILSKPNATTKLEKVTNIPLEKVDKLWYKIAMRESKEWNGKLREGKL